METATKPGSLSSDSEYLMTLRDGENGKGMKSNPLPLHLRDVRDVWELVFVTGIMGSASFALHSQKR